ncbi:hypothetical protein Ccrd_007274 [Cynara cardunculus var. scolymus]|uniref:Amino acid transporter transmembrane domain-containing protein n=1 Tax=Cynara cardunculus var. scolymus TaxID=59895 RepID=A0A103XH75_CYNCS|nr:hypothetical protein Ccrd_007274 [Cynara cardunculus var. scolymus]
MGTIGAVHEEPIKEAQAFSTTATTITAINHHKQPLDAGALFVLKSKVAPPLLSLPFAFASLGWTAGVLSLVIGAIVTFYSYNLISLVLEHHAALGHRHLRFRDMAYDILGTTKGTNKNYSLSTNDETRIFGIFNAMAIVATTFGNGIIPEIQATLAPPVKGKMFKGLCVCYAVVTVTFFSVAISGYWAFGNEAEGLILSNFLDHDGNPLVYLQPTNEVLEKTFADPTRGEFSARNVVPRVISRSISVILATTIAAMLPFFGDINAMIGAFGFFPLDFVLPMVLFNMTFKPSKRSPMFWLNSSIAVIFSAVSVTAAVAAVRQISLDAKTYKLFANV